MYTKTEAAKAMNKWGREQVPFGFVIDFEMQKIRLFRMDEALPNDIEMSLPGKQIGDLRNTAANGVFFSKFPISFESYLNAFQTVTSQIYNGNSFLLNLTFPTKIETNLTLPEIYARSIAKYKLLIDNDFVCFSPETFISIREGRVSSHPMKGTIKASIPGAERIILEDNKETAEHATIVDLIRNDLSMVASDVTVKRFRYVEKITTNEGDILQVSSEISGKLPENFNHNLGDIIFALLPAGSVTGAPKKKTIEIIQEVEGIPRGYYTGIFGFFDGANLESAVAIRFIEQRDGQLWFRSGGGITCNSEASKEYNELIDKVYVPIV
jgi:Anthranilate/para-aminobenzoate synthases component I